MGVRDEAEAVLRGWDAYERETGGHPVADFDCAPTDPVAPVDRETAVRRLSALRPSADGVVGARLDADLAYLGALAGDRPALADYVRVTQGCSTEGWSDEYAEGVADTARSALEALGVPWGRDTSARMREVEGQLDVLAAPAAIDAAVAELEPLVRELTGATGTFLLHMEPVAVDAYWAYWLDGAGSTVRLRLNLPRISFTRTGARQFALHEVLGHGLQSTSYTALAAGEDVPWVRVLSVHALYQVMLEGLAQALPLFVLPDEPVLAARVRLDHHVQMVRARTHLAVNSGVPVDEAAAEAVRHMPWVSVDAVRPVVVSRRDDPLLRSYLWVYPAGMDWFVRLADTAPADVVDRVLRTAYRTPLTVPELVGLWPDGPLPGSG